MLGDIRALGVGFDHVKQRHNFCSEKGCGSAQGFCTCHPCYAGAMLLTQKLDTPPQLRILRLRWLNYKLVSGSQWFFFWL